MTQLTNAKVTQTDKLTYGQNELIWVGLGVWFKPGWDTLLHT